MFFFLRSVIRFISVVLFLFSFSALGTDFNEWMMIQPSLRVISGNRVERSAIRLERSKQQFEEAKAGKLPTDSTSGIKEGRHIWPK